MTDATLSIILTALPPTIVALAGLIIGVINSIKSNKIHVLVNSNMTKVQSDLVAANLNIRELQSVITKITEK